MSGFDGFGVQSSDWNAGYNEGAAGLARLKERIAELEGERDELRHELERERVRLAGCSVASIQGNKDNMEGNEYGYSASYHDVCVLYDRMVAAEAERDELKRQLEKSEKERDALRNRLEWQPMETAPKDTTLLLHDQLGGLTLAYYCEQMECWLAATGDLSTSDEHTGWMRPWEAKQ